MRTNSKWVQEKVTAHIIESVGLPTISECANEVYSNFKQTANYPYNLHRLPNEQARFSDWMAGLPYNFEVYTYKIEEFLNSLGINPEGKKYDCTKTMELYHYLIYKQIKKYGTNK
jgi:hypothetical protein